MKMTATAIRDHRPGWRSRVRVGDHYKVDGATFFARKADAIESAKLAIKHAKKYGHPPDPS